MSEADFVKELTEYERPYRRMVFSFGDPGAVPVTKLGGAPWWPAGTERPICEHGHQMLFIAQIRLDEVPGIELERPPTLLSFHYCEQCMADGNMAFGWHDKGRQLRYRVSLFTELEKTPIDELGIVVNDCSREEPKLPTFHDGVEVMCLSEIWEEFPGRDVPDLQNIFNEERSKLGGWPYWWHEPEYPEDELGNPMQFVAQLHLEDCPDRAWACGSAYLYVSEFTEDEPEAEFIMQST